MLSRDSLRASHATLVETAHTTGLIYPVQVLSKDFLDYVFNQPEEEPRRILMYMG